MAVISILRMGEPRLLEMACPTMGNEECHFILCAGKEPSYDAACQGVAAASLGARLMVDFSHGDSCKQFKLLMEVGDSVVCPVGHRRARPTGGSPVSG